MLGQRVLRALGPSAGRDARGAGAGGSAVSLAALPLSYFSKLAFLKHT